MKTFVWACDLDEFRGEGVLAWIFIKYFIEKDKKSKFFIIESYKKSFFTKKKKIISKKNLKTEKLGFYLKYVLPFIGVFKCWIKYMQGYKVCYVNYLPLWNFLIFFLLPPKTVLGPITGGQYYTSKDVLSNYIRKYIFPIFFKISLLVLNKKRILLFSTDLLSKFINKIKFNKIIYNFVLLNYKPNRFLNYKKKHDIIIYHRKHANKSNDILYKLVKFLINYKIKILIVGDKLNIPHIDFKKNISRTMINKYINQSKFALNSGENSLSLFTLDCISNNTFTFINILTMSKILNNEELIIPLNFNKFNIIKKKILHKVNTFKIKKKRSLKLLNQKNKIQKELTLYFHQ